MALQYSTEIRNAQNDCIPTAVGNAGLLRIYSGTPPANVAAALSGNTLLAELVCGSPLAPASSSGVLTLGAIADDASANATGTASFFRIYESNGTDAHIQGTVTATGGGGDMTLATTSLVSGAVVEVTSATITRGNA